MSEKRPEACQVGLTVFGAPQYQQSPQLWITNVCHYAQFIYLFVCCLLAYLLTWWVLSGVITQFLALCLQGKHFID